MSANDRSKELSKEAAKRVMQRRATMPISGPWTQKIFKEMSSGPVSNVQSPLEYGRPKKNAPKPPAEPASDETEGQSV